MTTYYANKPASYIQERKRDEARFSLIKRTAGNHFTAIVRNKLGVENTVTVKQDEINRLARILDYWRTDKSNDFIPSDEQVDAWIAKKTVNLYVTIKRKR